MFAREDVFLSECATGDKAKPAARFARMLSYEIQGRDNLRGKAKNLKNRVRQYFQSSRNHTPKVCAMVSKVDDFDIVLVDGDVEALILECNLIKAPSAAL